MRTNCRIPFGDLRIGPLARAKMAEALDRNFVTEGPNVAEFERRYAEKFGWRHAIATSSGTTAGEVAWAAVRGTYQKDGFGSSVITPACAFVATANCLFAARLNPVFCDINLATLNLDIKSQSMLAKEKGDELLGVQFVMTMGNPHDVDNIVVRHERSETRGLIPFPVVIDACEAHGATLLNGRRADRYGIAAIYSFYPAHLIVGGEGGIICTDDDEIAGLCRSIKSHGRPMGSNFFDFQRAGFNAKWNDLCAIIALESLEKFDETFAKRREVRAKLIRALEPFEDELILYRDAPGEVIAPHAFPVVLRDEGADVMPLYRHLERAGLEVKTLFGSLPTQHGAFAFMGHRLGDFPVAERIGRMGLHFGCHEYMTLEDVDHIAQTFVRYFQ